MIRQFGNIFKQLRRQNFIDLGDYRETVFLAGTGRSGTTWVQEIINNRKNYRILFEPFHSEMIDLLSDWNYRQYLRYDNRNDKFLKPATAILSGAIRHEWIDKFNERIFTRKRLIKDIRAQLLLKWINHNFPEIPIILLLRHPCAVASSKLSLGWDTHLDDFLGQDDLMCDFLNPFKQEIEGADDPFDKHIFMWCIENYVPLRQFSEGEILVTFYEDLCRNPQDEIKNILAFIGEPNPPDLLEISAKPSALSQRESAIISGADTIDSWRKNISDEQIERSLEICGIFGLQAIYDDSSLPLLNGKEALNSFPAQQPR